MQSNRKKKRGAWVCALIIWLLLAAYIAAIVIALVESRESSAAAIGFTALYGGIITAVAVGLLLALRSRLREIDGGEEEEAGQY